jgi:hypothetical protein
VIIRISFIADDSASSTTYWITGLSTTGSISFGCAFVAGITAFSIIFNLDNPYDAFLFAVPLDYL